MGSLAEDLEAAAVPPQWQAKSDWDGQTGTITTGPIAGAPLTDFSDFLRTHGHDPDLVEVVGKIHQWRKEQKDKTWRTSYFFGVEAKRDKIDLPALYGEIARTRYRPLKPQTCDNTVVVVWADMQLGEVGSRGGTPELLARLNEKRSALEVYLKRSACSRSLFIDAGDSIEGFENVASQMFTNDLSLPQQLDVAATEIWKTLVLMARHSPVDAVAVPSNHGAWRNGKQSLGRPSDDWGIAIQRRLEFQADLIDMPVTFGRPDDWDEGVAIDVRGTSVGVHHGHQANSPDGMPRWWAGQVHGGQAVGQADVLITGHFHHLRVQPTGRNPRTGRSKWWLQAPTLDNGSDWFRNRAGDDSDPGLLVFRITDDGLDLQSLTVL